MRGKVPAKTVMIVDDEPASRSNLREVIESFPELTIIAEIADGKSAIEAINKHNPDIVFLDIEMPEIKGFEVARATSDVNYQLVFITAHEQYALDAFDTNAIDYILKPARPLLLEKCISKILHQEYITLEALQKKKSLSHNLVLSDGNALRVLEQRHVVYIGGIGRYRRIHLTQEGARLNRMSTIISSTTLDEFELQLPKLDFVRLHRSYIVNSNYITMLSAESRRYYVNLKGFQIKIPVSREKVSELKKRI
jgi:DNA-binding LytR/AlgR family response regulator